MKKELSRTFSEQFKNIENKVPRKPKLDNMKHKKVEKLEKLVQWFMNIP
jgi:hypothetical protein